MTPQQPRGGEGLLNCPFCGGSARFEREHPIYENRMFVGCDDCCAESEPLPRETRTEAEQIALWNRRPTAPSASGGEAPIGWVKRTNENHPIGLSQPSDWRFSPHKPLLGEGSKDEWFDVREVFAHPARMPTREEVEALLRSFFDDQFYLENVSAAILALFHTGETKGDGRG